VHGRSDEVVLVTTNLVFITVAGVVAILLSRRRLSAQRQLQIQAWHLRQLLPGQKRWDTKPIVNPSASSVR
jgi:hypothetical protein